VDRSGGYRSLTSPFPQSYNERCPELRESLRGTFSEDPTGNIDKKSLRGYHEIWKEGVFVKIRVKLFAALREFGPPACVVEVLKGATLADLVKTLSLPADIPLLMIVNGVHESAAYLLKEGDEVALFPPIAGG
jgi:molybdopterin converting factor small subunit